MSAYPTLAIEASGLEKSFGNTHAVRGVDLAVQQGSVYGILGPNGAGKSTTIRILATLVRPDAGMARVLGHDIVRDADAVRGAISLTGQLASMDEDLSGGENLILFGRLLGFRHKRAKARAAELLQAFKLEEAAGRLVKDYSGGMRRRLDIAASIIVTPELLFLDEPTTGLDPRSRNQVWDIVRALAGGGTTILLCTQYLEEADQLADGIAVIDHGRVIAESTPAQLKASVGSGALDVRLLDPAQSRRAQRSIFSRAYWRLTYGWSADPVGTLGPRARNVEQAAEALGELSRSNVEVRGLLARPANPRRSVPCTYRPSGRATGRDRPDEAHRHRRGAQHEQPRPQTLTAHHSGEDDAVLEALAGGTRPQRASALSAVLAFAWRGMLKIKHVPEQLMDVTLMPVLMVFLFTYLFGGAIAGSTSEYLQYLLPGLLVFVLFSSIYSGVALNTDVTKGVVDRSLPLAADPAALAAHRRGARRHCPLHGRGERPHRLRGGARFQTRGRVHRCSGGGRGRGRLRLRILVGLHHGRAAPARTERRRERRHHGLLPAHLPQQRVRPA